MAKPDIQYIRYYTAGSAAEKLAPAFREDAKPARRRAKKPVLYIDPVAILGMMTALVLVVCMFVGLASLNQAKAEYTQADAYTRSLENKNEKLTRQYAEGYDLEELRLEAVLMGYVPASQVQHLTITVPEPVPQEQEPGFFEAAWIFLTELLA